MRHDMPKVAVECRSIFRFYRGSAQTNRSSSFQSRDRERDEGERQGDRDRVACTNARGVERVAGGGW